MGHPAVATSPPTGLKISMVQVPVLGVNVSTTLDSAGIRFAIRLLRRRKQFHPNGVPHDAWSYGLNISRSSQHGTRGYLVGRVYDLVQWHRASCAGLTF